MSMLTINCPACGEARLCEQLARKEYSPAAPLVAGWFAGLVFALSRKRRYGCGRCGQEFYQHTPGSRCWLGLWVCFCVLWVCVIAIALLAALFKWR
jgi:hypothetical protein